MWQGLTQYSTAESSKTLRVLDEVPNMLKQLPNVLPNPKREEVRAQKVLLGQPEARSEKFGTWFQKRFSKMDILS